MKNRIWLLTGLMVLSIYLMVGSQAYADSVIYERFIYDEDNMEFDPDPNHTKRYDGIFKDDFNPTIPSACYISTDYAYEARIITTGDFFEKDGKDAKGKVLFLVLNKDNDPFRGTCGGSLVKQFQLWLPNNGGAAVTEVLIRRGEPGKGIIEVLLTFPGFDGLQGGGVCPYPPCGP